MRDVAGKVDVAFCPTPQQKAEAEFFVRQRYRTDDRAFLTLEQDDLQLGRCPCDDSFESYSYGKLRQDYRIGDTVLYIPRGGDLLEPGVVASFDDAEMTVTVRCLQRLSTVQPGCKPNELLFTQQLEVFGADAVVRRCQVRVFGDQQQQPIEAPYDRDGSGDCFYVRSELTPTGQLRPLARALADEELRQGLRLGAEIAKPMLRGMDLFCGGGNFGRGLEEGGVVQMKYAVDFDDAPLHSYRANMKHLDDTKLYLGSINNYLQDAIEGRYSEEKGIPRRVPPLPPSPRYVLFYLSLPALVDGKE